MANLKDLIKKYEENSTGGNFPKWLDKLKDDGDNVMVRFLHSDDEDLDVYEVHTVEVDGFNQKIECIGEGCPLCKAGNKKSLRMFLQMVDLDDKDMPIKIWERGIGDIKKILEEIEENGALNKRDYKIKRIGKKGSTQTMYMYYAKDKEEREIPQRAKVVPYYVKSCSADDMRAILSGNFTFKKEDKNTNTETSVDETSAF